MDILIGVFLVILTLIGSVFIGRSKWFDRLMKEVGNHLSK